MPERFLHTISSSDIVATGKQIWDRSNYTGDHFGRDIVENSWDLLTNGGR